jgi:hypothetical protein
MNGNDKIGEVRGVLPHQEVEPLLQETLDSKLGEFGSEADRYKKKSEDMKRLTSLDKATEEGKALTHEDLRFLYEIDGEITGFGYQKDPRIEELRKKRNRQEDIQMLCNCTPEYIAKDFLYITETTQVFCEDTGKKITFFDFREEKNREKLPQLTELAKSIKESGSPARPDMSFEGGLVNIKIDKEKLKDIGTALQSYKEADNSSPSWTWEEWNNLKSEDFITPESKLDVVVLSYNEDPKTRKSSDKIVADMGKLNLRPATIAELISLGIVKPEFNKVGSRYLVGLGTKAQLVGDLQVPILNWD